jgi:gluconolactonase
MKAERVATGVRFGEGPTWREATRDLISVSVLDGLLHRIDPFTGTVETFADTAGGPNATTPCDDGGVLVTQNGGIDFKALGEKLGFELVADPPAVRYVEPGLQRVWPDGRVASITDGSGPFHAPNDLAVGPDNAVYFTDPPHMPPPPGDPLGRIWRATGGDDGEAFAVDLVADGFFYCNGIGFEADGTMLVVEGNGLLRLDVDGGRRWLIEDLGPGGGDGFAIDTDGNVYVCGTTSGLVRVVGTDGKVVDELPGLEGAFVSNCCFGGDDLRTLFVTDSGNHSIVAFEGAPAPGLPIRAWSPTARS